MGLVHEKTGDEAAAEGSYNKALELAPEWAPPKNRLEQLKN